MTENSLFRLVDRNGTYQFENKLSRGNFIHCVGGGTEPTDVILNPANAENARFIIQKIQW